MSEEKKPGEALAKIGDEKTIVVEADFGQVYLKVIRGQIMAPLKARMTLYERLGQIYKVAAKREKDPATGQWSEREVWSVTAAGYSHLNKVASISLCSPQNVIVDGQAVPNPHIERDRRTKAVESVNIRRMGIGYSPAGNIVIVDKTLFYNVYTYLIQGIQAKMKRTVWKNGQPTDEKQFPNAAAYGIKDERPKGSGSWHFFAVEMPLGIWVNYEDQAIIDCLEDHTQRQRFGERIAQRICDRNILKDHPAIAVAQVAQKTGSSGTEGTVYVHGWRNANGAADINDLVLKAEAGMGSSEKTFEGTPIVVDAEEIKGEELEEEQLDLEAEASEDREASSEPIAEPARTAPPAGGYGEATFKDLKKRYETPKAGPKP